MAVKLKLRGREFLLTVVAVVAAVIVLAGLPSVWIVAHDHTVQSSLSNFNFLFREEQDNAGLVSTDLTVWKQLPSIMCQFFASITSSFFKYVYVRFSYIGQRSTLTEKTHTTLGHHSATSW